MNDKFSAIEEQIQAAEFGKARQLLLRLSLRQIPREQAVRVSSLARRCGLISTSLRILNPIVRDHRKAKTAPTEGEIADYAFSLHRSGSTTEAESLLKGIGEVTKPETLLYRSIIDFSLWQYDSAIPLLEKYTQMESITAYQQTIGKLNLASAYVQVGLTDKARDLLSSLSANTKAMSKLIVGLQSELEIQMNFLEGNLDSVRNQVLASKELISGKEDRLQVWITKWDLLSRMKTGSDTPALEELEDFRVAAARLQSWEQLRDFDYYRLVASCDQDLLNKLRFGTPYKGFTNRLEKLDLDGSSSPDHWVWQPTPALESTHYLDLRSGKLIGKNQKVTLAGQFLTLARSLCSDLYRPPKTGTLFSALFPDEYYDPIHSPNRVHQAIFRFNSSMEKQRIPIRIHAAGGNYFLKLQGGFGAKLYRETLPHSRGLLSLDQYRDAIGKQEFRAADFSDHTRLPRRTAQRAIQEGMDSGTLERIGTGKASRYRFAA